MCVTGAYTGTGGGACTWMGSSKASARGWGTIVHKATHTTMSPSRNFTDWNFRPCHDPLHVKSLLMPVRTTQEVTQKITQKLHIKSHDMFHSMAPCMSSHF